MWIRINLQDLKLEITSDLFQTRLWVYALAQNMKGINSIEYNTLSRDHLKTIYKIGHMIHNEFILESLILSKKHFEGVIHSLVNWLGIHFSEVLFDFDDIIQINPKTRFMISELGFEHWPNVNYNFLEQLFYMLSVSKTLCESLKLLWLESSLMKQELYSERERFTAKAKIMGFKYLKVEEFPNLA